jgi:nucleoside-diphosphate-sugar epimerase
MPRLLKAYHAGRLKRIGNGHNVADLTPVRNVVHAVACALQVPDDALGQAYNISAGGPVNLWQAIDDVLDQLGLEPVKGRVPVALAMAAATIMEWIGKISGKEPVLTRYSIGILTQSMSLNIDKAREKLGYEPLQSTQEALKEFADWWLTLAEEEKLNL